MLPPVPAPVSEAQRHVMRQKRRRDTAPELALRVGRSQAEFERLSAAGVRFTQEPTQAGPGVMTATLDDTCGNLIQIAAVATP